MPPASRPQWQQATALITIGAGSVATGLSFVPKAAADLTTPASIPPVTLLALEHANAPAPGKDAMLRAAIVHIARHFLRLAGTRSPAEMEAMIWQYASTDGANHGPSCGAFASLTLELGSHVAGLDSWVTGGTSYPWPVHSWADSRVDPNPASPGVVSILQDAQSHGRWHPLGDGYTPQPGDWVLFDGHVEVVTKYLGGVLHTIGGDSLPNFSVNAHEYPGPLQGQGVAGFVDNGVGMSTAPGGMKHAGGSGTHGARAAAKRGSAPAAAPMAGSDPSPSGGPTSMANPMPGGAAAAGGVSGGRAPGRAAPGRAASPVRPVQPAPGTAQQPELAPRAIAAPRTVPRPRYAQESRALPAQGARPAATGGSASSAGMPARAARAAVEPQQHSRSRTGRPVQRTSGAARTADQPPQYSSGSLQRAERSVSRTDRSAQHAERSRAMTADVPATGLRPARPHHARPGEAAIPGLLKGVHRHHPRGNGALAPYHRHDVPQSEAPGPGTTAQQAFIKQVARGAMATQRKYGVPASVTIAQAIDESGWGQSVLATNDHNLFGIKGTGPAGADEQPTQEVINGQLVNLSASFQIYESIAQSIDAHGRLLAHSGYYAGAMAQSKDPNAFAAALTGVYATDPGYGAKLVQLMKQYDLYRFDRAAPHDHAPGTGGGAPATQHPPHSGSKTGPKQTGGEHRPTRAPQPAPSPGRDHTPKPRQPGPVPVQPAPIAEPGPGQPAPIANPVPGGPGAVTGPRSRAHDAKPARGPKSGASAAVQRAGTQRSGQAADHARTVHHDAATPPAAVLYPGRSARPAPLAHPVRPTDLARPPGTAPSHDPGASSARSQAQHPGLWPDPAPGSSQSDGGAQSGPGEGNISANAAIPGVPHAAVPRDERGHALRPISRIRPAHPARHPALPTSRQQGPAPTAAGNPGNGPADSQRAAAPTAEQATTGTGGGQASHRTVPATTAPTVSQAGGALIPGLQHHAPPAHLTGGLAGGTTPPDGAWMVTAQPGGSSVPGTQPGVAAGAASHAPPDAAVPGHAPAAQHGPAAANRPPTTPGHATRAPSRPARQGGAAHRPAGPASAGPATGSAARAAAGAHPGEANPAPAQYLVPPAAHPRPKAPSTPAPGGADVPGLVHGAPAAARAVPAESTAHVDVGPADSPLRQGNSSHVRGGSANGGPAHGAGAGATLTVYHAHMPPTVKQAFITAAKLPLTRAEPLYRDVASHTGIRWEILAACDWMQCRARHGYSPVYGEKLGSLNPDETCYRTKSAALEQCASDLVQLARSVYQVDIATMHELSVRDLARVFAAYRWGGLLRQHCTSALDFPYSVAGLTADHTHMRWPNIDEPNAPDKPGSRFRQSFGAVPVVLSLNYQALM